MLAIAEALKEDRDFWLGAKIITFTDYQNLLANSSSNDRVFRWKWKIQDFAPTLQHVKGPINQEADALSRHPTQEPKEGIEAMLNHYPMDPSHTILNKYPLDLVLFNKYQQLEQALLKAVNDDPKFSYITLHVNQLISYQPLRSNRQCLNISSG